MSTVRGPAVTVGSINKSSWPEHPGHGLPISRSLYLEGFGESANAMECLAASMNHTNSSHPPVQNTDGVGSDCALYSADNVLGYYHCIELI